MSKAELIYQLDLIAETLSVSDLWTILKEIEKISGRKIDQSYLSARDLDLIKKSKEEMQTGRTISSVQSSAKTKAVIDSHR